MKKLLIFALCAVMVLSLAACGDAKEPDTGSNQPTEDEEITIGYADDPTVDHFIQDFMKLSVYKLANIRLGQMPGEYRFTVNQCDVILYPQENGLRVTLMGGQDKASLERALEAFPWAVLAMDPGAPDAAIRDCLEQIQNAESSIGEVRMSIGVKLIAYLPAVNMDTVKTDARIDLWGYGYHFEEEE